MSDTTNIAVELLTSIEYDPGAAAVGAGEPESLPLGRPFPEASGVEGVEGAIQYHTQPYASSWAHVLRWDTSQKLHKGVFQFLIEKHKGIHLPN